VLRPALARVKQSIRLFLSHGNITKDKPWHLKYSSWQTAELRDAALLNATAHNPVRRQLASLERSRFDFHFFTMMQYKNQPFSRFFRRNIPDK
jgi:hypothetical protein